jgi:hypothetical protein
MNLLLGVGEAGCPYQPSPASFVPEESSPQTCLPARPLRGKRPENTMLKAVCLTRL